MGRGREVDGDVVTVIEVGVVRPDERVGGLRQSERLGRLGPASVVPPLPESSEEPVQGQVWPRPARRVDEEGQAGLAAVLKVPLALGQLRHGGTVPDAPRYNPTTRPLVDAPRSALLVGTTESLSVIGHSTPPRPSSLGSIYRRGDS